MSPRVSGLAAAVSAVALLVGVPLGLAVGLALASHEDVLAAVARLSLGLELASACGWAGLFLAIRRLSSRYARVRSAPHGAIVFLLASITGALGFYRTEPVAARILPSLQYGFLVLLALWLFGFVESWCLPSSDIPAEREGDQAHGVAQLPQPTHHRRHRPEPP